jgi:hypothetical protein
MKIIILTETRKNESVQLIKQALDAQYSAQGFEAIVVEKQLMDKTQFDPESGNLIVPYVGVGYFPPCLIPSSEIALVVVRTWTDKRDPVIALSRALRDHGLAVLDVDAVDWSLSKIDQYQSLQPYCHPFPDSICFSGDWLQNNQGDSPILAILEQVRSLDFPLVIKTSRGSRGTGVYRVLNETGLFAFLSDYFSDQLNIPKRTKDQGLIIQRYIPPYEPSLMLMQSVYFRVNVVEQKICSVVQFEIHWESMASGQPYEKINIDTPEGNDRPILINAELQTWYESMLPFFPHPLNVVGLDVIKGADGQYYLLEVNCSPNISCIEKLGHCFPALEGAESCRMFSNQIAQLLLKRAQEYVQTISLSNETNHCVTNSIMKL